MDFGAFNWVLITGVGVAILFGVLLFARIKNQKSDVPKERTEAATHRLYQEEEAAHRGEGNNVP